MFKNLRYFIYFTHLIFIIIFKRPEKIVILFGSRFGHFLSNTEIFFQESYLDMHAKKNYAFIILDQVIDSEELKIILEKTYRIKIHSGYYAYGFYLYGILLKKIIIDTRPKTEPNILPVKSLCSQYITEIKKDKPQVTISLRSGYYTTIVQKDRTKTNFRDTPIYCLEETLDYLIQKNYEVSLVNKAMNASEIARLGVIDRSGEDLKSRWGRVKGASFHIGTCTGFDMTAAFSRTPIMLLNGHFGCSFNSRLYTHGYVAFVLPMLIYSERYGKNLTMLETIDFLKKIEEMYGISSIVHDKLMYSNGLKYVPNSENDTLLAVKELEEWVKTPKPPTEMQSNFWNSYPEVWKNAGCQDVTFHHKNDKSDLRVSQIYLNKYCI